MNATVSQDTVVNNLINFILIINRNVIRDNSPLYIEIFAVLTRDENLSLTIVPDVYIDTNRR